MDLIKLSETNKEFPVDSRDLHEAMNVSTSHSTWIQRRLEDFIEPFDYLSNLEGPEKVFYLSLDEIGRASCRERV